MQDDRMYSDSFPELNNEASLAQKLACVPLDPVAARRYARRKYLLYFFVSTFALGLPAAVFALVLAGEWGLPRWLISGGTVLVLLVFFVFFYGMIGVLASRGKILRQLGIHIVQGNAKPGLPLDVAMVAERHGRRLEYGISQSGNFWRHSQARPAFFAEYRAGTFHFHPPPPAAVQRLFAILPSGRLWRGLKIQGGPRGLTTRRPARLAKYFLHDLWLLEKILESSDPAPR